MADLKAKAQCTTVIQFEETWYTSAVQNLSTDELGELFKFIYLNGKEILDCDEEKELMLYPSQPIIKAYIDWYYKSLEEL